MIYIDGSTLNKSAGALFLIYREYRKDFLVMYTIISLFRLQFLAEIYYRVG